MGGIGAAGLELAAATLRMLYLREGHSYVHRMGSNVRELGFLAATLRLAAARFDHHSSSKMRAALVDWLWSVVCGVAGRRGCETTIVVGAPSMQHR